MARDVQRFDLGKVKAYLDGVFSDEEYIRSFADAASDVYRVYNHKERVTVRDVEDWLRGLAVGVDYYTVKTEELAKDFALDWRLMTRYGKSLDEIYWWALAEAIWVFGAMETLNPQFKKRRK